MIFALMLGCSSVTEEGIDAGVGPAGEDVKIEVTFEDVKAPKKPRTPKSPKKATEAKEATETKQTSEATEATEATKAKTTESESSTPN